MPELNTQKEIEVVTRIVRGDTYQLIADDLGVSTATISAVKKRQSNAIAMLSQKLLERKQKIAERILEKTHELLENRVDDALQYEKKCEKIEAKLDKDLLKATEINDPEQRKEARADARNKYNKAMTRVRQEYMTTSTAVQLAKEMNAESTDDGSPNLPATQADSKAQLVALVEAIQSGDEVRLQQIILNPK